MRSGPRNTDDAPLKERSKSSRGDNVLQNMRLILVEENYNNRSRHSHAAVIIPNGNLAPERKRPCPLPVQVRSASCVNTLSSLASLLGRVLLDTAHIKPNAPLLYHK